MTFLFRSCTLFLIYASHMHIIVQGSREHQASEAFLKQSIYNSLRSTPGCLEGVDRRALHPMHPSGIDQAKKYLREIGKDEAYYKPDPSMVNSYVTYMCETKKFGGGGKLPVLPQEYVVCLVFFNFSKIYHTFVAEFIRIKLVLKRECRKPRDLL